MTTRYLHPGSTLVEQFPPTYVYANTGHNQMGQRSTRSFKGFPVTVLFSIRPEPKTATFTLEAEPSADLAPHPVLFVPHELSECPGLQLVGWDRVFWMYPNYVTTNAFRNACSILVEDYGANMAQINELAQMMAQQPAEVLY